MNPEPTRMTSSIPTFKDDLVVCSHRLQRTNACLDVLWRAACHDANHGGYPEFVELMRQQLSDISDYIGFLAGSLKLVESSDEKEAKDFEETPSAE